MPASYRIDQEQKTVFSGASGIVDDADLLGHLRKLRADPDFDSNLNQLWDFRNVDKLDVTTKAIRALAAENPFGSGSRRAIVVDTPLAFGLARMFQTFAEESENEIELFQDRAAAVGWLQIVDPSD